MQIDSFVCTMVPGFNLVADFDEIAMGPATAVAVTITVMNDNGRTAAHKVRTLLEVANCQNA